MGEGRFREGVEHVDPGAGAQHVEHGGLLGGVEEGGGPPLVRQHPDPYRQPVPRGRLIQDELQRVTPLRERLMDGPVGDITIRDVTQAEKVGQGLAEGIGDFRFVGPVWTLVCDEEQTNRLIATASAGASAVTAVLLVACPPIGAAAAAVVAATIAESTTYIKTVDALGGNNGVSITGVIGQTGLFVVPRGLPGFWEGLIEGARIAVAGRTVIEFLIAAAAYSPAAANLLAIPTVAAVFSAVSAGSPIGWAIAFAVGSAIELLDDEPDPDDHGHVVADRATAGEWEAFIMAGLGDDRVSLLSHVGLLSAKNGGGSAVYANRVVPGDWETWRLVTNADGTVSLQAIGGHYFVAEDGGGRECNADRVAIGDWEKFWLVNLPSGKVALRTLRTGTFVSVQP